MANASWRTAALAPFRTRIFLAIWTASLISNFGSLIQAVGASWLMTTLAPSPAIVALVQASTTLPIMLLSLPSGAIADIWDRRIIMLIAQSFMLVVSAALALFAFLGYITEWSLLALTFLLGCGVALYGPAWQSSVGEQVPREHLPAAISLNILSYNLARTAGPAIGGFIVASAGAEAAFLVNALSYVALIVVLSQWHRPKPVRTLPPESIPTAIATGVRYARLSPEVRTVLVRGLVYGFLGSSIWALMPLIAKDLVGGGAATYGVLFGAFGGGAVLGAVISGPIRQRYTGETMVRVASVAFGASAVAAALSPWLLLTMFVFLIGGAAWVLALSTFNITIQTSSPRWVVGRALAIYQMVTFGGLAIGSWLWGLVASHVGLSMSVLTSGAIMILSVLLGMKFRLPEAGSINLDPVRAWPEPTTRIQVPHDSGAVVVTIEYRIAPADRVDFVRAMQDVRRIRRRDGARRWTLLQDVAEPEIWVERFQSPSWVEHLRHHHRFTVADREIERRALAFHRGDSPPKIRHYLERLPGARMDITQAEAQAESERISDRAMVTDPNLPPDTIPAHASASSEPTRR